MLLLPAVTGLELGLARPAGNMHVSHARSHPARLMAAESRAAELAERPSDAAGVFQLASALFRLEPTPLALAELTDAIDKNHDEGSEQTVIGGAADTMRRLRRTQLLADLLREDRSEYLKTVTFLPIPRAELPNRQDVPLRACDAPALSVDRTAASVEDDLVADCVLEEKPMGENPLEAVLLRITRGIYATETGVARSPMEGINGLLEEMRTYMLSVDGSTPAQQQLVLVRTLRVLMTPFLPPFYRIFMGGIVPSVERGDPQWLVDSVQWAAEKLPTKARDALAPGSQIGPWFYAPTLTSVVAPYAFGFLVGPASLNLRSDGQPGGLVVEKCKFLQESNCKGMCLNSCKLPVSTKGVCGVCAGRWAVGWASRRAGRWAGRCIGSLIRAIRCILRGSHAPPSAHRAVIHRALAAFTGTAAL